MLANREAEDRERSEFIISAREPRAVLGNCKIGCPIFLSFFEYIACFFFCQWRHGAFCVSRKVYDRWITSNFRANDTERRLKFIASGKEPTTRNREAERASHCTAKATSSTQRPQHVQRQQQNTTITLQMQLMKKGNTDCRRFKNRWGDQATLEVYNQNYLLRCNGRQQQLHDLYNAREKYFSNAPTEDSRQPLHHEQQWCFVMLSFISLQWTVYNTDNVWQLGKRYICKSKNIYQSVKSSLVHKHSCVF